MVVTIILYKKQSLILGYPIVNNSTYTFIVSTSWNHEGSCSQPVSEWRKGWPIEILRIFKINFHLHPLSSASNQLNWSLGQTRIDGRGTKKQFKRGLQINSKGHHCGNTKSKKPPDIPSFPQPSPYPLNYEKEIKYFTVRKSLSFWSHII